jgi:hypothetical protein
MTEKLKYLTIGLQTHNRIELAKSRIISIYERGFPDWVEFIVLAEKKSNDNTWLELERLSRKYLFTLYCGRGLGFSDAFMQVIINSKGKYCMHLPDEDDFNVDSLFNLRKFLNKESPDMVVADYFIQDKSNNLRPYRINTKRVIDPIEFLSCSHNPGIIWNVKIVKRFENDWNVWRSEYKLIASYYPHLLLMVKILPDLSSWFYDEMVSYQKDSYKHQHVKYLGNEFNDLSPRWVQFKELNQFIMMEKSENKQNQIQLDRMLNSHNSSLYSIVRNAINNEKPELLHDFDSSAKKNVLYNNRFGRVAFYAMMLLRNPALLFKKIRLKLRFYSKRQGRV